LLPEDKKVSFLVGMYVMLSKAYVPNCRPTEAKTKELEIQHYVVVTEQCMSRLETNFASRRPTGLIFGGHVCYALKGLCSKLQT
jgi:hypothetical protein